MFFNHDILVHLVHWCQRDDRNCNYNHPNMADTNIGKCYKADYSL